MSHLASGSVTQPPASLNSFEKIHRLGSTLRLSSGFKGAYFFVLHADSAPTEGASGGTERHVAALKKFLNEQGFAVFELFPIANSKLCLRGFFAGKSLFEEFFHPKMIGKLIQLMEGLVDVLHVQHLLKFDPSIYPALENFKCSSKMISFHDFYQICPTVNMLMAPDSTKFCEVEADLIKCNACLRQFPELASMSIEAYRERTGRLLMYFDVLLFPSETVRNYFLMALPAQRDLISEKSEILAHRISYLWGLSSESPGPVTAPPNQKVVFLGSFLRHKGAQLFLDSVARLNTMGFRPEIVGAIHKELPINIEVTPYSSPTELAEILRRKNPAYICTPSLTAETFCFAFYEGMVLGKHSIPIVGPFGSPARVVKESPIGVVMRGATDAGLIEAIQLARTNFAQLWNCKQKFIAKLKTTPDDELNRYLTLSRFAQREADTLLAEPFSFVGAEEIQRQWDNLEKGKRRWVAIKMSFKRTLSEIVPSSLKRSIRRIARLRST